jgi:hydroxyacylglutathione hydrolase
MTNYSIPFYLHGDDSKLLRQANIYKYLFESKDMITIPTVNHDLREVGTKLVVSGMEIGIIHTPGHTKGSVCLEIGSALFSGDTLLPSGPGRTDLPGADKGLMRESIDALRQLDGSTIIYPGHGKHFELNTVWRKIDEQGPLA